MDDVVLQLGLEEERLESFKPNINLHIAESSSRKALGVKVQTSRWVPKQKTRKWLTLVKNKKITNM